jgi:hypothetical protein
VVSDLEPIGADLEALLARIGLPSLPPLARLVDAWAEVAGEPWAADSRPAGLEEGVLVVEVTDGMRASLLSYQTGALLARLGEHLGPGVVHSVRIRVGRPENPQKSRHSGDS